VAPVFLLVEQTFTALVFIFKLVSPSDSFFLLRRAASNRRKRSQKDHNEPN
jgi:hypothetical protein